MKFVFFRVSGSQFETTETTKEMNDNLIYIIWLVHSGDSGYSFWIVIVGDTCWAIQTDFYYRIFFRF